MNQLYLSTDADTHARVDAVFEHYRLVLDHPRARLDVVRRSVIVNALSWGYTVDDLQLAIEGVAVDPWCSGRNTAGRKFHEIERILGKADAIDRYIEGGERLRAHLERRLAERRAQSSDAQAPAVQSSSVAAQNLALLREIINKGVRV